MGSLSAVDEISHSIRQEIIRFESVHPNIYAIYDLVDAITDKSLAESLRHLVVSIEDAFVNSQEWTLSHDVPDIKLGLLGSVNSGKSALVHRYLTGTYLHEESPEGGRFKKEVSLESQSHLLLIRDEGGPPDQQFSHWVDGVIFVFSLENYESYQTVYDYFARLSSYRNLSGLPILLVGTQDSNCESYVRVIDDARARKLANDLKRCVYYETCSAYGLNVERVFQDACLKVFQARCVSGQYQLQRPNTPQYLNQGIPRPHASSAMLACSTAVVSNPNMNEKLARQVQPPLPATANMRRPDMMNNPGFEPDFIDETKGETNESLTPSSTPTHSRKNRRKSNLFKKNDDDKDRDKKVNGIGSGRAIPLKQGFLYKRTCKPLSKEWKTKKYVTLTDDARLTYHPSIHEYMENTHGKEIDLSRTTVKIPGIPFRQVGGRITSNGLLRSQLNDINSALPEKFSQSRKTGSQDDVPVSADSVTPNAKEASCVKKRHRRVKSNVKSTTIDGYDSEGYEFQLISVDRQWHFEAKGPEERDEWVMCIEKAIMTRLQLNESNKRTRVVNASAAGQAPAGTNCSNVSSGRTTGDRNSLTSGRSATGDINEISTIEQFVQNIRSVPGNEYCADCSAPDPDWASLNLGAMVCISCSGIHRQLGTHISRIRSLHLDEWSSESVAVMCSIGNTLANSVWEAAVPVNAGNRRKPGPSSSREEKEAWIRAKYDHQEFLPPLPYPDAPLQQQLIDAIARQDTRQVVLCLALATPEMVNAPYSRQDPRAAIHIAATLGNLVYLQLLLWYHGDPTVTDHEGRNAYYYAHCSQKYECAEFLRRSGCPKQLVPPVNNASATVLASRSIQPSMAFSQPPVVSASHGQLTHSVNTGAYSPSVPVDSCVPVAFGNPLLMPSTVSQPYHFSHLQQQTPSIQSSYPNAPLIGQLPGALSQTISNHPSSTIAATICSSSLSYSPGPLVNTGSPHTTMLQSLSSSIPSAVLSGSSSGALVCRASVTSGQHLPVVSSSFLGGVTHALGATLPRRRAPIAVPPTSQPLVGQHLPVSAGTHRPYSGAVIDRVPIGIGRSNVAAPSLGQIACSYGRVAASSTVSTSNSSGTTQQYTSSNHEVGL